MVSGIGAISFLILGGIALWRWPRPSIAPHTQVPTPQISIPPTADPPVSLPRTENILGDKEGCPRVDVPAELKNLLLRHRTSRSRLKDVHDPWKVGLSWDKAFGYTHGRLLALCYPDEVESSITKLLSDPTISMDDRLYATKVLTVLGSMGRGSAETGLVTLIAGTDPDVVCAALDGLASCDKEGKHRALYWAKCNEGIQQAFWQGPYWPDPQTRQSLTLLLEKRSTSTVKDVTSQEALERMAILESPERVQLLSQLVSNTRDSSDITLKRYRWQLWALKVIELSPPEKSLELLGQRLELGEAKAAGFRISREGETAHPTHQGYGTATGDEFYDSVLLLYQKLGGKLNRVQTERLTYYGYLGDPKERLAALLAEGVDTKR